MDAASCMVSGGHKCPNQIPPINSECTRRPHIGLVSFTFKEVFFSFSVPVLSHYGKHNKRLDFLEQNQLNGWKTPSLNATESHTPCSHWNKISLTGFKWSSLNTHISHTRVWMEAPIAIVVARARSTVRKVEVWAEQVGRCVAHDLREQRVISAASMSTWPKK